ncbi:MAG: tRNA (adenosine(37)-N6)-threonylcarbamoyltransferase complex dimerization subunit type 1 TsaB [Chthoniobacterales bacterium]
MSVLAIDCSGHVGSLAVVDGDDLLFHREFDCPRGRGTGLFVVLEEAMQSVTSVHRIVVGIGPGSYNGLRASIAAAEGAALARQMEKVGILSLIGLDGGPDFWAAGDARGGTMYLARITGGRLVGEIQVLPTAVAISLVLDAHANLPVLVPAPVDGLPHARICHPDARRLARHGVCAEPVAQIEPFYAKPVHITSPSESKRPTLAASARKIVA